MFSFLKQIRACKAFMELSGLYTPSVLLYKWFNVITIWNLLNIPQARSRSRAPSLSDGRRYSKGSYLIYCWRGKALCAGLETANSSPCLSSRHTEQLLGFNFFFFLGSHSCFYPQTFPLLLVLCPGSRAWKGIVPSPPWSGSSTGRTRNEPGSGKNSVQ